MGRMIYGMSQSLDGYIANDAGEITVPAPEEGLHRHFNEQMRDIAVCLYGRKIYEIMRYWETADRLPESKPWEVEFARIWQATPKVVVSTSLKELGPNATLINADVDARLRDLKASTAGNIDVAGPTLAATCSRLGLIDEYRLYLHPVVLGGGLAFFSPDVPLKLRLTGSEVLPEGVHLVRYAPVNLPP